jgi:hypothetical protein
VLTPPPRQRGRCPHTRVPSIDECSLHPACARDHEEPATVLTVLPPRAGFRRPFASCAPRRGHPLEAERLDPTRLSVGQAPLVDFCNQTLREHEPLDRPNPDQRPRKLPPGCASREAPPMVLTRWCRTRRPSELVARSGSRRLQPRFHGPGAGWLSPPCTSRRDCSRRELCPNPISSGTSCRDLVAPPAGEANVARHPCWTGVGYELTRRSRFRGARHDPPQGPLTRCRGAEGAVYTASNSTDGSLSRTPPGAQGRLTCSSAKRDTIRRTRGAFFQWATPLG